MFKVNKVLTPKQLKRVKLMMSAALVMTAVQTITVKAYQYMGESYEKTMTTNFTRGSITTFTNREDFCECWILPPGMTLLSDTAQFIIYMFILFYLFLGIAIVSDVFMEGIEHITSATKEVELAGPDGKKVTKKVAVWNPTMANLTLMALGSAAPEILLSTMGALTTLGEPGDTLGPSSIVGSASYNLLIVSAVAVMSITPEQDDRPGRDESVPLGVKRINDLGVFAVTSISSIWAYVWMFMCLEDYTVTVTEAVVTFSFFIIMVLAAFIADKINARRTKTVNEQLTDNLLTEFEQQEGAEVPYTQYKVKDFYETLVEAELVGENQFDSAEREKAREMKEYLQTVFKTDKIDMIDPEQLRTAIDGERLIERTKYRAQQAKLFNGARPPIAKFQKFRSEDMLATKLDDSIKNKDFGFHCLKYSVSEGSGYINIKVLNKGPRTESISVGIRTIDGDATKGEDYVAIDEIITFKKGQSSIEVPVTIIDDDGWEPDEDFFVELYDPEYKTKLEGVDCKTTVTIIDDDEPGTFAFHAGDIYQHIATEPTCQMRVIRSNGSSGEVNLNYKTIELNRERDTASPGIHYEHVEGTLTFDNNVTEQVIEIPILQELSTELMAHQMFGVVISDIYPRGAKLTKKNTCMIELVVDASAKKQSLALQQLLERIKIQEEIPWSYQFTKAAMLHPSRNEEGEIEDVSTGDCILHFLSVGWKFLFACVPPPHYCGGYGTFFTCLAFIGVIVVIIGDIAEMMGCSIGIKLGVTAITFVAIGTSLPDTFASKIAAQESKFADSAVGNITGSNAVNVFLGLGLPWVVSTTYSASHGEVYTIDAEGLPLTVILYVCCSTVCLLTLCIRRCVVGGELGGSTCGRISTGIFFTLLWITFVGGSAADQYGMETKWN